MTLPGRLSGSKGPKTTRDRDTAFILPWEIESHITTTQGAFTRLLIIRFVDFSFRCCSFFSPTRRHQSLCAFFFLYKRVFGTEKWQKPVTINAV